MSRFYIFIRNFLVVLATASLTLFIGVAASNADSQCPTFQPGEMVKVAGKSAIYAVNSSGQLEYFPDGETFKSWTADNTYSGYALISQACYEALPVSPTGVGYRPGSYVVKRPSSDSLYVVEPGNVLAPITTSTAAALYGPHYIVKTIPDYAWPTYGDGTTRGATVTSSVPHPGMIIMVGSNEYYVDNNNTLRPITENGWHANHFQPTFEHSVLPSMISGFTIGEPIDGLVTAISDRTQSQDDQTTTVTVPVVAIPLGSSDVSSTTTTTNQTPVTVPYETNLLGIPSLIQPTANQIISPATGDDRILTADWTTVAGAASYTIEIDISTCTADFAAAHPTATCWRKIIDPINVSAAKGQNTQSYTTLSLGSDGNYQVRIEAVDQNGQTSGWSAYVPFSFDTSVVHIVAPSLLLPLANQIITSPSRAVPVSWKFLTWATKFEVEADCASSASWTSVYDNTDITGLSTTMTLPSDGACRVHVRGYSISDLWGPWSDYTQFTVDTSGQQSATVLTTKPTITSPTANASYTGTGSVNFNWTAVAGAAKYAVNVSCSDCSNDNPWWNIAQTDGTIFGLPIDQFPSGSHSFSVMVTPISSSGKDGTASDYTLFTVTNGSSEQSTTNAPTQPSSSSQSTLPGLLTYDLYETPPGKQIAMDTQDITLARYRLVGSSNEALQVNSISFQAGKLAEGFIHFHLVNDQTKQTYGDDLTITGGNNLGSWTGLTIPVAQNGTVFIDVVADANTLNSIIANNSFPTETASTNIAGALSITSIDYTGVTTHASHTAIGNAAGNIFSLLQTTLAAGQASGVAYATAIADGATVGAATFSAGTNADACLNFVAVSPSVSGGTFKASNLTFHLFDIKTGQDVAVSSFPTSFFPGGTTNLELNMNAAANGCAGGAGLTIAKGTSHTFLIKADLADAGFTPATLGVPAPFQTAIAGWDWSDGIRTHIQADSTFNLPISGQVIPLQ